MKRLVAMLFAGGILWSAPVKGAATTSRRAVAFDLSAPLSAMESRVSTTFVAAPLYRSQVSSTRLTPAAVPCARVSTMGTRHLAPSL